MPKAPQHLADLIEEKARTDAGYAIAHALMRLADAQGEVAQHIKYLGNGNASTSMGAIEAFGLHIGEKLDALTDALANRD
jgi:hypothetical protein